MGTKSIGTRGKGKQISLWAYKLTIEHPITKEKMGFLGLPEPVGPWVITKDVDIM